MTSVSEMVARIRKHAKPHLYMRQHREARDKTLDQVAASLDVARNTIWRWENEQWRLDPGKIKAYADVLGIDVRALWSPPTDRPSLDSEAAALSDDLHQTVVDIIRRLTKKAS